MDTVNFLVRQWEYIVAILSERTYLPIYLYVTPKNLNMKKKAPPPKKINAQ